MSEQLARINRILETEAPAVRAALSPLGRESVFPPDIPFQAGQARGKTYNGTIGVFTDGKGHAVPLPSIARALDLDAADRDAALLYSPVAGIPEVRDAWRAWQRRSGLEVPSSRPIVCIGLSQALALVADLFGGPGRTVAVATPFWGNYRQVFGLRTGAVVRTAPSYRDGAFEPRAWASVLEDLPDGEPAVVIVNFPSNPGGYSPTDAEREELVASLVAEADRRPLTVVCDDAYAGLVYEEGIRAESIFWDLSGRHPSLLAVKVDGATKEFGLFGGRVGFLTFGIEPDSGVAEALESKVKCLLRAGIGSPVALGQVLLLQALRSADVEDEVEAIRRIGHERWEAIREPLAALDPALLRCLPFNSGFFALLELPEELGLTSEAVRQRLLAEYDTGVVSIAPRFVRIATCSVEAGALPEMVRRVEAAVRDLAGA